MSLSRRSRIILPIVLLAAVSGAAQAQPAAIIPHPELWPSLPHPSKDPAVETFVARLVQQMSLEEKVGQMIQADIDSISPSDLRTYKLGSILAGGNAAPGGNVRTTPAAWLRRSARQRQTPDRHDLSS
jgi:beta-glucosidase